MMSASEIVSRYKFSNLRALIEKPKMSFFNGRKDHQLSAIRESHEKRDYRREIKYEPSESKALQKAQ
jgi:hypothetical protein